MATGKFKLLCYTSFILDTYLLVVIFGQKKTDSVIQLMITHRVYFNKLDFYFDKKTNLMTLNFIYLLLSKTLSHLHSKSNNIF